MTTALPPLRNEEKRALLWAARLSAVARVEARPAPALPAESPRLVEPQGAFVTIHLRGELHGCIGLIDPARPLLETVSYCAAAAATEDPRFPPLKPSDLGGLSIEITALAPRFTVHDLSQIVLGRHGLMAHRGSLRGVLLPQVAVMEGFDVRVFVRETLRKAGLPLDALERGQAILEAFEAEVFSEDRPDSTAG